MKTCSPPSDLSAGTRPERFRKPSACGTATTGAGQSLVPAYTCADDARQHIRLAPKVTADNGLLCELGTRGGYGLCGRLMSLIRRLDSREGAFVSRRAGLLLRLVTAGGRRIHRGGDGGYLCQR